MQLSKSTVSRFKHNVNKSIFNIKAMDKRRKKSPVNQSERIVEKLGRKAIAEEEKRKKPGECLKYLRAIIDVELKNSTIGSKIGSYLDQLGIRYEAKAQVKSNIIYWQRSTQQTFASALNEVQLTDKWHDEGLMLVVVTGKELNNLIKANDLLNHLKSIEAIFDNKQITLLVFGLKEFCRQNPCNIGRLAFETALTEIQLLANISHRLLDTADDLGNTVMQFSKSVAEIPYKADRAMKASEQNFYIANDNKDCVNVKGEIGLSSLWQRHLIKIPLVTLETAEAIIKEYPKPSKLIEKYESTDQNGPLLLAEIPIRRAAGIMTAARKVGAEMSKKIHALYTNTNPNYIL